MSADTLSGREIQGMYYERLEQDTGADWVPMVSNYFESDQESEEYRWLFQAPMMRQWVGGRHVKELASAGITIENLDFEATLDFSDKDLRRDKTGQSRVRIEEMADRTNSHWAKLLTDQINLGETVVGYDGEFFFDTDHQEGNSGTLSNKLQVSISGIGVPADERGTTTNPTADTMEAAIRLGVQQMYGFKDDTGEPINETASSFLCMTPVGLWSPGIAAVTVPSLSSGRTNTLAANPDLSIVSRANARLNYTNKFVLFRTDGSVRPLIRQEEVPPESSFLGRDSEYFHNNRRQQFGIYASRNVGFGRWQHACQVELVA